MDELAKYKPLRVVYGNIDGVDIRQAYPENLRFACEEIDVWMTHIGGYPKRYDKRIKEEINRNPPKLFICGHSHILKVMYDKKYKLLHMNPGAIGDYGIHAVKTILCFSIEGKEIKNLRVIEFPRSKIQL